MTAVGVDGLTIRAGQRVLLDNVSVSASAGECIAIAGPNGAGKSTLLRTLAGLIPQQGRVRLNGQNIQMMSLRQRARLAAYLPQQTVLHWPVSIAAAVLIGRAPYGYAGGSPSPQDKAALDHALAETGLTDLAARRVDTLSGGERARVAFARFLVSEAPVLLADEPIAALDAGYQVSVLASLARLAREGRCVICVLHDLTLAARWATRAILMHRGRIAADGPACEIMTAAGLEAVYQTPFTHAIVEGKPVIAPSRDPRGAGSLS